MKNITLLEVACIAIAIMFCASSAILCTGCSSLLGSACPINTVKTIIEKCKLPPALKLPLKRQKDGCPEGSICFDTKTMFDNLAKMEAWINHAYNKCGIKLPVPKKSNDSEKPKTEPEKMGPPEPEKPKPKKPEPVTSMLVY